MFRALRLRLALVNGLILTVLLGGLGAVGLQTYRVQTDRDATVELERLADRLRASVAERGIAGVPDHHEDPSSAAILVGVFDVTGRYLGGTAGPPPWLAPKAAGVTDIEIAGDPVRFVTGTGVLPDGSSVTIVVARSLQRLEQAIDRLLDLFLGGVIEILLLSGIFGWWVSGRMIRPIARSYEAQRTFAADASHELRTPLTFIRAGVEVLAPAKPELGAQILDEVDYMTSLTDRLLLLARSEGGQLAISPAAFDVAAVCRSAAERARGAHALRVDLRDPGAITATGDPVLTETIVDALLENASRHGGGSVEVRCANGGRTATVSVIDRGPGIPGGDHERILERFARIDASRDRASGGAGLGLPLARTLARAQGGDLRLSPTPGGGLTATLELPAD